MSASWADTPNAGTRPQPPSPTSSLRSSPGRFNLGSGGAALPLPLYPAAAGARATVDDLVDKALNRTAAVQVVIRVRPMNSGELSAPNPEPVLRVAHEFKNDFRVLEAVVGQHGDRETVRRFTFDRVAPPEVGQAQLFEMSGVKELMDAALTGLNASVFAYGQTGSGKTYTMSGIEERLGHARETSAMDATMGIIPRAIQHLYHRVRAEPEGSSTIVRASFAEIYNEEVYDLLHLTGKRLPLRFDQVRAARGGAATPRAASEARQAPKPARPRF
jgi:hypothetical protein